MINARVPSPEDESSSSSSSSDSESDGEDTRAGHLTPALSRAEPIARGTIASAWYGALFAPWDLTMGTDVTTVVASRVSADGWLNVRACNSEFGDPAPGKEKVLIVRYRNSDGEDAECSAMEQEKLKVRIKSWAHVLAGAPPNVYDIPSAGEETEDDKLPCPLNTPVVLIAHTGNAIRAAISDGSVDARKPASAEDARQRMASVQLKRIAPCRYVIKSCANGNNLQCRPDGTVAFANDNEGEWESWSIEHIGGNFFFISDWTAKVLQCDNDGNLLCRNSNRLAYEAFSIAEASPESRNEDTDLERAPTSSDEKVAALAKMGFESADLGSLLDQFNGDLAAVVECLLGV